MMKHIIISVFFVMLMNISCTDKEEPIQEVQEKGGILSFNSGPDFQNKIIPIHYFIPKGEVNQMDFQIVMHGDDRKPREYLAAWAQKAREYGLIVIAPEFSEAQFSTALYHQGNAVSNGQLNRSDKMTFVLIDEIFEHVKKEFDLKNSSYNIFGHSAGAQFVHRFLQFYNSPHLKRAVAANSGWYTFPDENINFPYGIRNVVSDSKSFRGNYYQKELILLLGTADTLRTGGLRTTAQADNQGKNRLERGNNFFQINSNKASSESHPFKWKLTYAENIGHSHSMLSPIVADLLYK